MATNALTKFAQKQLLAKKYVTEFITKELTAMNNYIIHFRFKFWKGSNGGGSSHQRIIDNSPERLAHLL